MAAARLLNPGWEGRHVQAVHGPEHLSYRRIAEILGDVLGRSVTAEQIPDDDLRATLRAAGLGERQVEAMLGMSIGTRDDFTPADSRTALTTTPTTLRAWAHDVLGS